MVNISSHDLFWSTPITAITPMTPNEIAESFVASSSMLRCSGVLFSSTYSRVRPLSRCPKRTFMGEGKRTSSIMAKITPNSVCRPVATTMPAPRPLRTSVPIYATHARSASATGSLPPAPALAAHGKISFRRAAVSPVRLDSSISRARAESSRTSAGTRSPVEKVTRSPGTSSFASRLSCWPSLEPHLSVDSESWGARCKLTG